MQIQCSLCPQYLGDWYAAYANPTWFQTEETSCSRARYTPNDDGSIGGFNSGEDQSGRYVWDLIKYFMI